ncbi:MAG: hypothetical protein ACYCSN_19415, partial [Acidobacteriaceae bacterium]
DYREFLALRDEFKILDGRTDALAETYKHGTLVGSSRIAHELGLVSYKITANLRNLTALLERAQDTRNVEEAAILADLLGTVRTLQRRTGTTARKWRHA